MERNFERFLGVVGADQIVRALQGYQYVQPHHSVARALDQLAGQLGFCPQAAGQAVGSLQLDPARSIGRLRGSELAQLGRTLFRYWRQTRPALEPASAH